MASDSESDTESLSNPEFIETYACFPLVKRNKKNVERGGKLLLPLSAIANITSLDIPYPLIFKVTNNNNNRFTHAGVFEFTAEEGQVNAPQWMIKSLGLKTANQVTVQAVSLPSATYCCLEPLTRNFAYISDAKTVLEQNLRNFACLTEGDILFVYETNRNQEYKLRVVETKPAAAVNILDCEMELELAVPEKVKRTKTEKKNENDEGQSSEFKPFQGRGHRLDGRKADNLTSNKTKQNIRLPFIAFKGEGYTLSGKRGCEDTNSDEPPNKKQRKAENSDNTPNELIFLREQQKAEVKRKSAEQIKPFQGPGHSLKDD